MKKPEYEVISLSGELFTELNSGNEPCEWECALYTHGCVSQCVTFSLDECEAMNIY